MRKISLFIIASSFGFIHPNLMAQTKMTASSNMPRHDDTVCKRHIAYFNPGAEGQDQIWDFRDLESLEEKHNVKFYRDTDTTQLCGLESNIVHKYVFSNDTLLTIGYESRLRTMCYQQPITLIAFPCSLGDRSHQKYHGIGTYCQKYVLETSGTLESQIDASGTILLNEEDTLHHVLRLHQVFSANIAQYLPDDTLPALDNNKRRIEERYQWYARGYRYPVFESVCVTIYNDWVPVTCQKNAYCFLPSDQALLKDSVNEQILVEDSLVRQHKQPIIQYSISAESHAITLQYTLDSDATINATVCDRAGIVYTRSSTSDTAGSHGIMRLNCKGLKSGIYVLYLHVGGQVFSEKIELN